MRGLPSSSRYTDPRQAPAPACRETRKETGMTVLTMAGVRASAVDCRHPACKGDDGECVDDYPCTGENDRVSRVITDPEPMPADS